MLELEPLDSERYSSMEADYYPREPKDEYKGPERRHTPRRICIDRRSLVRFEIDKQDRRSDHDRREDGIKWGNFYSI